MGRKLIVVCVVVVLAGISAMGQAPVATPDCGEMKARLDRAETRLNDWPALARYREDNSKVAPSTKHELRVVFMGDDHRLVG